MAFSPIGFLLSSVQAEREGVSDPQARTRLALLGGLLGGSPVTSLALTTVLARNEKEESGTTASRFVRVPDLQNKSPEQAEKVLRGLGLKPASSSVHNKKIPEGLITSQHPDGGVIVPEGAKVRFYVSRGPEGRGANVEQDTVQSGANEPPKASVVAAADGGDGGGETAPRSGRSGNAR